MGMEIISEIMKTIAGRMHFMVFLGNKPAADIEINDKEITVTIKNPVAALELGIEEFFSGKSGVSDMFQRIKKMGYNIRIKYKIIEVNL
jgi:hypothetical protein